MINFLEPFIPYDEPQSYSIDISNFDWLDIKKVYEVYQKQPLILADIPLELLNSKSYYDLFIEYFPIDLSYNLFSSKIKENDMMVKEVFPDIVGSENLHFFPKSVLNDPGWMIIVYSMKPYLYYQFGEELRNDVTFNIRLLKRKPEHFPFTSISSTIFNSHLFLLNCCNLVKENQLDISTFFKFLPQSYQDAILLLDNKLEVCECLEKLVLKNKITAELTISNKSPKKLIKL